MEYESGSALERRSKERFPLRLSVRYRTLSGGPALLGTGRTLNVSSCGLLIAPEDQDAQTALTVLKGSRLQLTVEWPFLLHGDIPLQLICSCKVTRAEPDEFAVKLDQYQFKTKKR